MPVPLAPTSATLRPAVHVQVEVPDDHLLAVRREERQVVDVEQRTVVAFFDLDASRTIRIGSVESFDLVAQFADTVYARQKSGQRAEVGDEDRRRCENFTEGTDRLRDRTESDLPGEVERSEHAVWQQRRHLAVARSEEAQVPLPANDSVVVLQREHEAPPQAVVLALFAAVGSDGLGILFEHHHADTIVSTELLLPSPADR